MTNAKRTRNLEPDPASESSPGAVRASMHDPSFVRLLVDASPDIRSERVDALRQAIRRGIYEADPRRVAEGMIRDITRGRR